MVMGKIVVVDEDEGVVEAYRMKLAQQGFEVLTASDGLAAVKSLEASKREVVVLDLMMPKFNGFEVLKYLRSEPELRATRVVVLSNFYIGASERQTAEAQADATVMKSGCTPALLMATVSQLRARPAHPARAAIALPAVVSGTETDTEAQERHRIEFLKNSPMTLATLRQLNDAFIRSDSPQARLVRLLEFYRKAHFFTATAP